MMELVLFLSIPDWYDRNNENRKETICSCCSDLLLRVGRCFVPSTLYGYRFLKGCCDGLFRKSHLAYE